jgi:hypothetical protein
MTGPEEFVQPEEHQEADLHHLELNPDGAAGTEGLITELPECPSHYPTSFIRGKPRCIFHLSYIQKLTAILNIVILALSCRELLLPLMHYFPCTLKYLSYQSPA